MSLIFEGFFGELPAILNDLQDKSVSQKVTIEFSIRRNKISKEELDSTLTEIKDRIGEIQQKFLSNQTLNVGCLTYIEEKPDFYNAKLVFGEYNSVRH